MIQLLSSQPSRAELTQTRTEYLNGQMDSLSLAESLAAMSKCRCRECRIQLPPFNILWCSKKAVGAGAGHNRSEAATATRSIDNNKDASQVT
jgi:hypothetical protein